LFYVWWSSTQPKAKMIWYLDSAYQNSWKTLSFSNSSAHTHEKLITNQLYSSDKIMAQVTKTLIIHCLKISHSTKSKNDLIIGFTTLNYLEITLFQEFIYSQIPETNFQVTLQQWPNHGSCMKNTCYLLFEDLPLKQK